MKALRRLWFVPSLLLQCTVINTGHAEDILCDTIGDRTAVARRINANDKRLRKDFLRGAARTSDFLSSMCERDCL